MKRHTNCFLTTFFRLLTLGLAAICLMTSCEDVIQEIIDKSTCKEEIQLEDIKLSEDILNYIPYETGDTLIFKNNLGESAIFMDANFHISQNRLSLSDCRYHNADFEQAFFKTVQDSIRPYFRLKLLTSIRLNSQNISIEEIRVALSINQKNLYNDLVIHSESVPNLEEVTLLGRTFKNLFTNQNQSSHRIYFQKERGIIAFEDASTSLWVIED